MARIRELNFVSLAGLSLVFGGLLGIALGVYLWTKAEGGLASLDAVYEAQNRTMSYNEAGQFIDRGTVEAGDAILALIEDDWEFPLNRNNLDPDDPLVNTPDELMVQYGIIMYHTLHGTQTVVLAEDVEYNGVLYEAGEHEVPVDGKYFSDLDRRHPLEGAVRNQAWSPLQLALSSQLIDGVNADNLGGMAHFMSWSIFMGLGFMFAFAGVLITIGGVQVERRAIARAEAEARQTGGVGTIAPNPA